MVFELEVGQRISLKRHPGILNTLLGTRSSKDLVRPVSIALSASYCDTVWVASTCSLPSSSTNKTNVCSLWVGDWVRPFLGFGVASLSDCADAGLFPHESGQRLIFTSPVCQSISGLCLTSQVCLKIIPILPRLVIKMWHVLNDFQMCR